MEDSKERDVIFNDALPIKFDEGKVSIDIDRLLIGIYTVDSSNNSQPINTGYFPLNYFEDYHGKD